MANHNPGLHHYHARQSHTRVPTPHHAHLLDRVIAIVAIVTPIINVPQLLKIWLNRSADGVSAISWLGFMVVSMIWLWYGIAHRARPIIVMNALLIIIDVVIAVGAFLYS